MKKLILILAFMLMLPVGSMAGEKNNAVPGERLVLAGLEIAVSPGVFAYYEDDLAALPQWFGIATIHQGGTKIYATAQDSTSIYNQDAPDSTTITLGVFTTLYGTLPTQVQSASDSYWTDSVWDR